MTVDKIDKFVIYDTNHKKIYQIIFKILHCHALWIFHLKDNHLKVMVSDRSIWEHYWDKKYYQQDPNLYIESNSKKRYDSSAVLPFEIKLGTEDDHFINSGFMNDLYRMFQVGEFVSIMKRTKTDYYCFRFFTRNNRFVFLNQLLNEIPIIKHFVNFMIKKYIREFSDHPVVSLAKLKKPIGKTRRQHVSR